MSAISEIGLFAALAAGAISFLSPCVLPLVPGYVSYISGTAALGNRPVASRRFGAVISGASFVLGFSTVFVLLGASATIAGRLLLSYRYETSIIGGLLIVLFGIFMTGLVPMPWLERDVRYHARLRGGAFAGPYVLGLAFGFGWTPCIGPVLGAILTVAALSSTAGAGIVLLIAYSLGLGIPFLLSAAFTDGLMRRMASMRRTGRMLKAAAGAVMILMGIAMATGYMSVFSFWLLEKFPILTALG
jgi:cytochrome c-type biogenesis protein